MDSLIVAVACMDPESSCLYTADSRLLVDKELAIKIGQYRSENGLPPFTIRDIDEILA